MKSFHRCNSGSNQNINEIEIMSDSSTWSNYARHNERMGWSDTSEADRRFHEQERQRAEDRAREEQAREERVRQEREARAREESARRAAEEARQAAAERQRQADTDRRRSRW
jgi:membrane protein involved in colicin uptake